MNLYPLKMADARQWLSSRNYVTDIIRDELKSALECMGQEDMSKNIKQAIFSLCGRFLLADIRISKSSERRKALQTLSHLLHVLHALKNEGKFAIDSSLTKCTLTLSLSELRESNTTGDTTLILCDILKHSLFLMEESEQDEWMHNLSMECENSLATYILDEVILDQNILKPEFCLHVLQVVLELQAASLLKQGFEFDTDFMSPIEDRSPFVNTCNAKLHQIFIQLISGSHEGLSAQVLVVLIPLLVQVENSSKLLRELWDSVSISANAQTQALSMTCALADYYLPVERRCKHKTFALIESPKFWFLLQNGLCTEQPLYRKQALYLLKRAIDGLSKSGKLIHISEFSWDGAMSAKLQSAWQDLFLVFEALEEAQVHLVLPVLNILTNLFSANCAGLSLINLQWLLCAVKRVLSHPNQTICVWGIKTILSPEISVLLDGEEANILIEYILTSILPVLNSTAIFSLGTEVKECLNNFFTCTARKRIAHSFFSQLFKRLPNLPWGPVPLYYIAEALSQIDNLQCLHRSNVEQMKKLITVTLQTQSVMIRAATQSRIITCLINMMNVQEIQLDVLCDLLSVFKRDECLHRGTDAWNQVVVWLRQNVANTDASTWLLSVGKHVGDVVGVARFIVLLLDAENLQDLNNILYMLETIKDSECRLYADHESQNRCLKLLAHLVQESTPLEVDQDTDQTRRIVFKLIELASPDIISLSRARFQCLLDIPDFRSVTEILQSLEKLMMDASTSPLLLATQNCLSFLNNALNVLRTSNGNAPVQIYYAVSILKIFASASYQNCQESVRNAVIEGINVLLHTGQLGRPLHIQRNSSQTMEILELHGQLISSHTQTMWEFLQLTPDAVKNWNERSISSALEMAECAVELGGRNALIPLLKAINLLLPRVSEKSHQVALKMLQHCWTAVLDLRRNELFWPALDAFISSVIQPHLALDGGWAQSFILICARDMINLGDSVCGVVNMLAVSLQHLAKYSLKSLLLSPLRELILSALLFGPVHRKDQKVLNETCEYIATSGKKCAANVLLTNCDRSDAAARACAVEILSQVGTGSDTWRREAADNLVADLLEKDSSAELRKPRYFGDSHCHRTKHRILQGMLLLEKSISEGMREKLILWSKNRLLLENHQPSVKYQTEWLLVRLICFPPFKYSLLWEIFAKARELRAGAICSLIGVVLHTGRMLQIRTNSDDSKSYSEAEQFFGDALQALLPCTMAQHFNVRVHSQVAVCQLWNFVTDLKLSHVQSRFEIIVQGVRISIDQASGAGHTKHQQDFYFRAFHPEQHLTLQTIYEELPRLTNVARDEWISVQLLNSVGVKLGYTSPPLNNSDSLLQEFGPSPWVQRPTQGVSNDCEETGAVLQKKMIPWKWMDPTEELINSLPESMQQRKRCPSFSNVDTLKSLPNLIVVASLIDKAPNLGGLARTCEVMGASLVVSNISCAQERGFRALSMSAELWVPLCEVKPHQLPQFLMDLKKSGYSLIGAEQTAGSSPLNKLKFSPHTVLLLGNEREGIPANLLPLLDQCVEIPQFGVVRSLNVHVSGALFIWEYASQHLLLDQ